MQLFSTILLDAVRNTVQTCVVAGHVCARGQESSSRSRNFYVHVTQAGGLSSVAESWRWTAVKVPNTEFERRAWICQTLVYAPYVY